MAENGREWQKTAKNGRKWQRIVKIGDIGNGYLWFTGSASYALYSVERSPRLNGKARTAIPILTRTAMPGNSQS